MALTQEHFYNKSSFRNTLPERRCHGPKKLLNAHMKKLPLSLTTKSECLDTKNIVVDVADIVVDTDSTKLAFTDTNCAAFYHCSKGGGVKPMF